MAAIIFSQRAKDDLDIIHNYISMDSPLYAQRQVERILQRINRIPGTVSGGRKVPEFNHDTIREVFEGQYRIIYSTAKVETIEIITIIHFTRLFNK